MRLGLNPASRLLKDRLRQESERVFRFTLRCDAHVEPGKIANERVHIQRPAPDVGDIEPCAKAIAPKWMGILEQRMLLLDATEVLTESAYGRWQFGRFHFRRLVWRK